MIPHITASERALIMKEADSSRRSTPGVTLVIGRLSRRRVGRQLEELDKEVRELTLECRWETLHARDRVLAGLSQTRKRR